MQSSKKVKVPMAKKATLRSDIRRFYATVAERASRVSPEQFSQYVYLKSNSAMNQTHAALVGTSKAVHSMARDCIGRQSSCIGRQRLCSPCSMRITSDGQIFID